MQKIEENKGQYPNIAKLASLYEETKSGAESFTFEEMRLVEEVLVQADEKLKNEINKSLPTFI